MPRAEGDVLVEDDVGDESPDLVEEAFGGGVGLGAHHHLGPASGGLDEEVGRNELNVGVDGGVGDDAAGDDAAVWHELGGGYGVPELELPDERSPTVELRPEEGQPHKSEGVGVAVDLCPWRREGGSAWRAAVGGAHRWPPIQMAMSRRRRCVRRRPVRFSISTFIMAMSRAFRPPRSTRRNRSSPGHAAVAAR